jgi:hypothetical protein
VRHNLRCAKRSWVKETMPSRRTLSRSRDSISIVFSNLPDEHLDEIVVSMSARCPSYCTVDGISTTATVHQLCPCERPSTRYLGQALGLQSYSGDPFAFRDAQVLIKFIRTSHGHYTVTLQGLIRNPVKISDGQGSTN